MPLSAIHFHVFVIYLHISKVKEIWSLLLNLFSQYLYYSQHVNEEVDDVFSDRTGNDDWSVNCTFKSQLFQCSTSRCEVRSSPDVAEKRYEVNPEHIWLFLNLFHSRRWTCHGSSRGVTDFNDASPLVKCPSKSWQRGSQSRAQYQMPGAVTASGIRPKPSFKADFGLR